jgi:hypothetical protein
MFALVVFWQALQTRVILGILSSLSLLAEIDDFFGYPQGDNKDDKKNEQNNHEKYRQEPDKNITVHPSVDPKFIRRRIHRNSLLDFSLTSKDMVPAPIP